jgi:hypothetical protein
MILPPDIKKFVEALESGDYQQCQRTLVKTTGTETTGIVTMHCCLGVYDKVVLGSDQSEYQNPYAKGYGKVGPKSAYDAIRRSLLDNGCVHSSRLMGYNDGRGWTFKEIAGNIKEHYSNITT